ncbi:hypothetical protein HUU53_00525 [Candidatus Micrarchaeota archaeon]|nr:hypothetical protein [Candidatus Micrarchaeota archaeon]
MEFNESTPIYLNIPSVRSTISRSLIRWFVHAVEAKGGSETVQKLVETAKEDNPILERMLNSLKNRNISHKPISNDIHLVVVDSAPYHQEKSIGNTHSPKVQELVRTLNELGNRHGVFIHHITTDEIKLIEPKIPFPKHPFFTYSKTGIKLSPGGACNLGLTYIRAIHDSKYKGKAALLRIDDDFFPPLGKIKSKTNPDKTTNKYRNFFLDLNENNDSSTQIRGKYLGYRDNRGTRRVTPGDEQINTPKLDRKMQIVHLTRASFYPTTFNEDVDYNYTGEIIKIPGYLIHAGKTSTYPHIDNLETRKLPEVFGEYGKRRHPRIGIPRANRNFTKKVLTKSGLRLFPR